MCKRNILDQLFMIIGKSLM